jgi:hypothetical protein
MGDVANLKGALCASVQGGSERGRGKPHRLRPPGKPRRASQLKSESRLDVTDWCVRGQVARAGGHLLDLEVAISQRASELCRSFNDPSPVKRKRGDPGEAPAAVGIVRAGRPTNHADNDRSARLHLECRRA